MKIVSEIGRLSVGLATRPVGQTEGVRNNPSLADLSIGVGVQGLKY